MSVFIFGCASTDLVNLEESFLLHLDHDEARVMYFRDTPSRVYTDVIKKVKQRFKCMIHNSSS